MRTNFTLCTVSCVLFAFYLAPLAALAAAPKLNILFVNADDFRDFGGVFTRDLVKLPNLDRLTALIVDPVVCRRRHGQSALRRKRLGEGVLAMVDAGVTVHVEEAHILYRLGKFGISPNRIAVLGTNIMIHENLLLITIDLLRANFGKAEISKVGLTTSRYLPAYLI